MIASCANATIAGCGSSSTSSGATAEAVWPGLSHPRASVVVPSASPIADCAATVKNDGTAHREMPSPAPIAASTSTKAPIAERQSPPARKLSVMPSTPLASRKYGGDQRGPSDSMMSSRREAPAMSMSPATISSTSR